jgi:tetratricopeptide (TPR) repeat protein
VIVRAQLVWRYRGRPAYNDESHRGIVMTAPSRKEQLEAMLQDEPADPELHYMLAMEHVSEGNDAEAVRRFSELIALAPNYPPAYHMAARALVRLHRIVEAKAMLERGITAAEGAANFHAAGEMQELLSSLE